MENMLSGIRGVFVSCLIFVPRLQYIRNYILFYVSVKRSCSKNYDLIMAGKR